MDRNIQVEASEALMDVGVSIPFFAFRLPFR